MAKFITCSFTDRKRLAALLSSDKSSRCCWRPVLYIIMSFTTPILPSCFPLSANPSKSDLLHFAIAWNLGLFWDPWFNVAHSRKVSSLNEILIQKVHSFICLWTVCLTIRAWKDGLIDIFLCWQTSQWLYYNTQSYCTEQLSDSSLCGLIPSLCPPFSLALANFQQAFQNRRKFHQSVCVWVLKSKSFCSVPCGYFPGGKMVMNMSFKSKFWKSGLAFFMLHAEIDRGC